MHIPDGFLSTPIWAGLNITAAPAVGHFVRRTQAHFDASRVQLLGVLGSFVFAAQMINRDAHIFTCVDSGETSDSDIEKLTETPNDVHAGEVETSTTLAVRPELVRMDRARRFVPRFSNQYLDFSSARSVEWYARTAKISRTGVLGDPTRASREKGEQFWRIMTEHLVAFVEALKEMPLDEIYERRY